MKQDTVRTSLDTPVALHRRLLDVNVWFAHAVADHPHHGAALAWWNAESAPTGFSRLTP